MHVVYTTIKKDLISALPIEQAAYQPGHCTIEQTQTIQQIVEKSIEFQQPWVICFIDYTKAFDLRNTIISQTLIHPISIY